MRRLVRALAVGDASRVSEKVKVLTDEPGVTLLTSKDRAVVLLELLSLLPV